MEGVPVEVSVAGEMPPLVCVVAILAATGTGAEGEALVLVVVGTIMVVSTACRRAVWRRGRFRSSSCAGIEGNNVQKGEMWSWGRSLMGKMAMQRKSRQGKNVLVVPKRGMLWPIARRKFTALSAISMTM
jgi:hypothetical protein